MLKGDAFAISDILHDARKIVFGGAEIDEADAHAEAHDVGFAHAGEVLNLIDLLKQVVRQCDGDGFCFHGAAWLKKRGFKYEMYI